MKYFFKTISFCILFFLSSCASTSFYKSMNFYNGKARLVTEDGLFQKVGSWQRVFRKKYFKGEKITAFIDGGNNKYFSLQNKGLLIVRQTSTNEVWSHIKASNGSLLSDSIRKMFYNQHRLWILYNDQDGVTCLNRSNLYTHYQHNNSGLAKERIRTIDFDANGNIWFIYQDDEVGITQFIYKKDKKQQQWKNWASENTPGIPSDDIYILRCEKKGEGIVGDNVWIATSRGIAFYSLKKGKWTNLGSRQTTGTFFLNVLGIEDWFSDKPIRIAALEISEDAIFLCTNKAVYSFNGKKFNKIIIPEVNSRQTLIIYDISIHKKNIYAELYKRNGPRIAFEQVLFYDDRLGKWKNIELDTNFSNIKNVQLYPVEGGCYILAYSSSEERIYYFDINSLSLSCQSIHKK